VKLLYLISDYWFNRKMDANRRLYAEAFAEVLGKENFMVWGNGWRGYATGKSFVHNLRRNTPFRPDVVLSYKPEDHGKVDESDIPVVLNFNDMWDEGKTFQSIDACKPALLVCHHENDALEWRQKHPQFKYVHIPHCASKRFFYRKANQDRTVDCLLTGHTDETIYPLRHRFHRLLSSGRLPGEIRHHPGYRMPNGDGVEKQYADYAAHLRRSKIALVCSSQYHYALSKYIEAMAAGCVVVGDMPRDAVFSRTLGRHIVEIPSGAPDQMIVETVNSILSWPDKLAQRAQDGVVEYLAGYTMRHYAERFLAAVEPLI